jgi:hypothetical protein
VADRGGWPEGGGVTLIDSRILRTLGFGQLQICGGQHSSSPALSCGQRKSLESDKPQGLGGTMLFVSLLEMIRHRMKAGRILTI